MATTFVVSALRRKYAELKGVLKYDTASDPEPTLEAIRQVGNVLRMFSPGYDLSAIRPLRAYKADRKRLWTRSAMDVLRTAAEPMTCRQIAHKVAEAHGVTDLATLYSIECSLHASLERRRRYGVVRLDGEPKRWVLAR
jgi:hypothetical protein